MRHHTTAIFSSNESFNLIPRDDNEGPISQKGRFGTVSVTSTFRPLYVQVDHSEPVPAPAA